MSKAEMLKKAREKMADKKPEGNVYKVEKLTGETVSYTQEQLPEKPILHLQGNINCHFSLAENTSIVKLLVEDCTNCTVTLPKTSKIVTSTVEIWACPTVRLDSAIELGTLQIDICADVTVTFDSVSQLGQLVQAGVDKIDLKFDDKPGMNAVTGRKTIRETICQDLAEDDNTTQFITRLIDGEILTEEIIRMANDFPTTAREKAKHDEQIKRKEAHLTDMANKMVAGVGAKLGENETAAIHEQVRIASQKNDAQLNQDTGDAARAEYRKTLGNEQFKIGEYQQAAVHYTESLDLDGSVAAVWANRAMCWLKLANPNRALADADKCIELDPQYTKAHFRRGVALLELEKYVDACLAFRKTLDLDPKNNQAKSSIMLAEKKMSMLNR